jgi:hypothetical protein
MVCANGACQPTCNDGAKDGTETDVDCGGGACPPCGDTLGCGGNGDCQSGICQGGFCAAIDAWSKSFPDSSAGSTVTTTVAVGGASDVHVAGTFVGAIDFGGGSLDTMGATGGFFAKFDSSGKYAWATKPSATGTLSVGGMAADAAGRTFLAGGLGTSMSFGSATMSCSLNAQAGAQRSIWVAAVAASGDPLWCSSYGTSGVQTGLSVAVDGSGDIVVAGLLSGSMTTFGSTMLMGSVYGDTFVLKLDPMGKVLWVRQIVSTYGSQPNAVAVDGTGDVVVTGRFSGSLAIGGSMLTTTGMGDPNIYVVKLDATTGSPLWGKGFGDSAIQQDSYVAVDTSGNVLLGGDFRGVINFGGTNLTSAGQTDVFLAKLDPMGMHLWSKSFGDASAQVATGITLDGKGQPVLVGNFEGTVDFGGGGLMSTGGPMAGDNLYIAKLDPTGKHLWSRRFGDAHGQSVNGVAVDAAGAALLSGTFAGTLDFGGNPMMNPGGTDVFLAKLRTP